MKGGDDRIYIAEGMSEVKSIGGGMMKKRYLGFLALVMSIVFVCNVFAQEEEHIAKGNKQVQLQGSISVLTPETGDSTSQIITTGKFGWMVADNHLIAVSGMLTYMDTGRADVTMMSPGMAYEYKMYNKDNPKTIGYLETHMGLMVMAFGTNSATSFLYGFGGGLEIQIKPRIYWRMGLQFDFYSMEIAGYDLSYTNFSMPFGFSIYF